MQYTLKVGPAGEERLNLLNTAYNDQTLYYIRPLVKPDMVIADVGCGTGEMSCALAQLVPQGEVVAIDQSRDQLIIAEKNAARKGVKNIKFIQANAETFNEYNGAFDFLYSRFTLLHIVDAKQAFRNFLQSLKSKGLICIVDCIWNSCFISPPEKCFDEYIQLVYEKYKKLALDLDIGTKIFQYYFDNKLKIVSKGLIQPLLITDEEKRYVLLDLLEEAASMMEMGLIDEESVDKLYGELEQKLKLNNFVGFASASVCIGEK